MPERLAWFRLVWSLPRVDPSCGFEPLKALTQQPAALPIRMTVKDRAWLARRLVDQLGWDSVAVEGVVEALAAATSQGDVDDLVQSYMGGDPAAKRLVQQFISANGQVGNAALCIFVLQPCDERHSQN